VFGVKGMGSRRQTAYIGGLIAHQEKSKKWGDRGGLENFHKTGRARGWGARKGGGEIVKYPGRGVGKVTRIQSEGEAAID